MQKGTFKLYQRKDYTDKKGNNLVLIRHTSNRKTQFFKTGVSVKTDQWNGSEVINHPDKNLINTILQKKLAEYETKYLQSALTGSQFDPTNKKSTDFFSYCEQCLKEWKRTKKPETLRQHRSEINKLKKFSPRCHLSQVTTTFLNNYREHLYQIGNQTNTVWKSLKFLRTVIKKAHRERLIEHNPFELFEMPVYKEPKKEFLTKDQVKQILEKSEGEFRIVGTWFVIACVCGFRFSDTQVFNKSKIKNGMITIYTTKTGEIVSLPLTGFVKGLFERVEYKPLPYTNIHTNRILKALLKECEITEKITFHNSRNTAAMILLNEGQSMEVVSKILGHVSLRTTMIYGKISNQRIATEFKKIKW